MRRVSASYPAGRISHSGSETGREVGAVRAHDSLETYG
jgi:hypothetical protein